MSSYDEASGQRISNESSRRLFIASLEKRIFGNNLDIQFQIILFLASRSGRSMLADVYGSINSTDAAVRIHIRALEMKKIVISGTNPSDSRSKNLSLTSTGIAALDEYYSAIDKEFVSRGYVEEGNA